MTLFLVALAQAKIDFARDEATESTQRHRILYTPETPVWARLFPVINNF